MNKLSKNVVIESLLRNQIVLTSFFYVYNSNFSHYRARFSMPGLPDKMFYSYNVGPVHLISFNTEVYYRVNDFLKHSLDDLVLQYNWLEKDLQVHLCPSIVGYSRWNKSSEFPVKTAKNACLQLACALLRLLLIALNKDRSRSGVATPMPLFEK